MKRLVASLVVILFAMTVAVQADAELRPIVKRMLERLGWLQAITMDFALSDFDKVKTTAASLSGQAKKVAETSPEGPGKVFNQKLSETAGLMANAADKKDGAAVAAKMGEALTICYNCHIAIRDK